MNVKCSLEKGVSQKSGNEYTYLSIWLTPTYEKKVFLDKAEEELVKLELLKQNKEK